MKRILYISLFAAVIATQLQSAEVEIAREGTAMIPIIVAKNTPDKIRGLAEKLANGLGKISNGTFSISSDPTMQNGIIVGTAEEWPGILPSEQGKPSPVKREDYILKTEPGKVLIIGRTPLAVQDAIWDFLYRLGFRQYFPGSQWEIWPHLPSIKVDMDVMEAPDYYTRRLRIGVSGWPENSEAIEQWKERNRMVSGFSLSSGHAYGRIISMNKDFFTENPQAVTGTAKEPKLDASFTPVLDVVAKYACKELESNMDSVSMEPSDGGGWRENSPLGSPSDQAVTLANYAAEAIQKDYPGSKVGMYAYNQHSPPPTVAVNPNVVIGVATSFIKGGYTAEQLMKEWHEKGAEIGVREYWGVSAWDHALPGRARASDIPYIVRTIPLFYELGARYWDGEVTDAWGVHGLGCYLTSRLLWKVKEAEEVDKIQEEFFQNCFGPAAPVMKEFFEKCLLKSGRPMLSEDLVGRMYRLLDKALTKGSNAMETARILDFVIYTRYVELMLAYQNAPETAKRDAYFALANTVYRARDSFMLDRWTTFREIPGRNFHIAKAEITEWLKPAFSNGKPFGKEELYGLLKKGIASNAIVDFEPVSYSSNLVPYREAKQGEMQKPLPLRGTNSLYVYGAAENPEFKFALKGGLIYKDRGAIKLRLFSDKNANLDDPVAETTVPADGELHDVSLQSPYAGVHRLEISDGSGGTQISWKKGQRVTFPFSPEEGVTLDGGEDVVFYVPKGTHKIGGFSDGTNGLLTTDNEQMMYDFTKMRAPGYFSVNVPQGKDGTYWKIKHVGKKVLLTVPPYVARSPEDLLIPSETAEGIRRQ